MMSDAERRAGPRRRAFWVSAAAIAAALLGGGLYGLIVGSESGDARPRGTLEDVLALRDRDDLNVLFVLVDTLRADRLGAYGYERDTSPNLDALAATGIRFAQQVSQSSWTKCSMASLWTGLYPVRARVLRSPDVISSEAHMPAEVFQEAGFRTTAVWRNGWIAANFGFSQGFEIYLSPKPRQEIRAPIRRLENPNISLEANYRDSYDNSIRWVDSLLGQLFDELERRGLRERTFIVFSSDHGEAFGEHNGEGHARDVYGEVTQTPLILAPPFRLEPGVVVQARTENVDLWPTVLELMGLPALPDVDGESLVPQIVAAAGGESGPDDEGLAFAQLDQTWARLQGRPRPMVAVNRGRWRLIYRALRPEDSELFDKRQDPREQIDLAETQPEVTEALNELVSTYLESRPPPWGDDSPTVEIDEMQMNQLRALGYGVR
jgi:arylsulfatase A-like enzyme